MSSEALADDFAVDYIRKHQGEYFSPVGAKEDGTDRIKVGEKIAMNEKEIALSGIRDGQNITLTKIDQVGQSKAPVGLSRSGFVVGFLRLGESLKLAGEDGSFLHNTSRVQAVERQMQPDGRNRFTLKTASGATYEITINHDTKPQALPKTVENLNADLGLNAGSEVILIKRNQEKGDGQDVKVGNVLQGRLAGPLRINESVRLESENGMAKTTRITEVRRKWRTWMFRTSSGAYYEITPTGGT